MRPVAFTLKAGQTAQVGVHSILLPGPIRNGAPSCKLVVDGLNFEVPTDTMAAHIYTYWQFKVSRCSGTRVQFTLLVPDQMVVSRGGKESEHVGVEQVH